MKRVLSLLAIIMATSIATSCDKTEMLPIAPANPSETNEAKVGISFVSAGKDQNPKPNLTRAGGGTQTAWEKSINNATVIVFNAAGNIKFRRDLSTQEIADATTSPIMLVVPGVTVGDNCDFAVVANRKIPTTITTKTLLLAEEDNDLAAYNGVYADVSTKALRPTGFAMSGMTSQAIKNGTTDVTLVLKRVVAKININASTTQAFKDKYGAATITISNISLTRGALKSYLLDQSATKYSSGAQTFTQVQNSVAGANLFYIYEKATAASGARVLLTLAATYDADGLAATTGDQVPLSYEIELTGATGGKILRNGVYQVNAKIDGLTGSDVSLQVSISDWETLQTQDVILGN